MKTTESEWNGDKETIGFMKCYVYVHTIDHLFLFIETTSDMSLLEIN